MKQLSLVPAGLAGWVTGADVRAGEAGYDGARQADFWGVFGPEAYGYFTAQTRAARKAAAGLGEFWLMPAGAVDYSAGVPVWRRQDYEFITPPDGMAEQLLAAADFLPFEGRVGIGAGGAVPDPSERLNIRAAAAEWQAMRAALSEVSVNLATGAATLTVGPPARAAASGLIDKYRRTADGGLE